MTTSIFVERRRLGVRLALAFSTILCSGLAEPAFASTPHSNPDANGVDLTTGEFSLQLPVASIGTGSSQLSLVLYSKDYDNWTGFASRQSSSAGGNFITIDLGPQFDTFKSTDGYATSIRGTGATLSFNGSEIIYRTLDGTTMVFGDPIGSGSGLCDTSTAANCTRLPISISRRDGMTVGFDWTVHDLCSTPSMPDEEPVCTYSWRLGGVSNNAGYTIGYSYATDSVPFNQHPGAAWFQRTGATLSGGSTTQTVTYGYPAANAFTVTTPGGKTWRITNSGSLIIGVRRPSASSDTTAVGYSGSTPTFVTRNGVTTNYNYSVSGNTATMVVTDAQSRQTTIVSDLAKYRPTSVTDALNRTATYIYDGVGQPTEVTNPEGGKVQFAYDVRGNVTTTTRKAKPGSGLADIVTSAGYVATCVDASCNQPSWTVDSRGNQTDYSYDPVTGQPLSVTAPAASAGAVRPQTRFSYTDVNGVQMLTGTSACQMGNNCAGTADEVKTAISYDSHLQPVTVTRGAGDGSLSATTAMTYDAVGNVTSIDGPLPGAADTSRFTYDADRELEASMGPDPDGAGPLKPQATHFTYNADGQRTYAQRGTVPSQATDWTGFVTSEDYRSDYDMAGRKVADALVGGGSTQSLVQYGYDAVGRLECTTQRLNPAAYGSLPGACALSPAGGAGNDRITRTGYDAAGRPTSTTSGYGTPEASTEAADYTPNGQLASVTDGAGNKTSYGYDGFDRLTQTVYPVYAPGQNTSNGGDYEQLGYDANGNVTSRRLRDGQTIGYSYDALNRLTYLTVPSAGPDDTNVSYSYDNLGRLTLAAKNPTNQTHFSYDALGRKVTESNYYYSNTSQYDAAGRRTRLTWGDGFFTTYDYLATGAMSAIHENGGLVLASFGYDDLGRRTSLTRGNGTVTTYGYDAISRLSSLTQDLAGTASDVSLGFGYNPAGQIESRTSSNDAYSFTGAYNVDRSYITNGLNQYTQSGSIAPTYDAKGNLTSAGPQTYQYTSQNRLWNAPGIGALNADSLERLDYIQAENVLIGHDGSDAAIEVSYNGGAGPVARRYVFGPGTDEPLVAYEGSGTAARRYLHADERGSVIAVSDDAGNAIAINTYDEYGIPAAGNAAISVGGRFQYTGQKWIPSLGMYDYKARMYSPTLGRFVQTDPIGYGDGMNWYNYVGSDPVNATDPSGLCGGDGATAQEKEERCPDLIVTAVRGGSAAGGVASSNSGVPQPNFDLSLETPQNVADIVVTGVRQVNRIGAKVRHYLSQSLFQDLHDLLISEACCFTAGTPVSTPLGLRPIETLKIGDLVMSRDPQTGQTAAKPISGITPAHERRIWTVTVSYKGEDGGWADERYETTDDHPWRTADGHWVTSASLKHGQVLARENGTAIVAAVHDTRATKLTYNLEISGFHTYFVGKAETWVHNSCPPFVLFPSDSNVLGHIFRVRKGHYPENTVQARSEILSAVHNGQFTGPNQFGVTEFTHSNGDGTQTWVWVRNGSIYDAGYNPE